jgi:hypothetical protein
MLFLGLFDCVSFLFRLACCSATAIEPRGGGGYQPDDIELRHFIEKLYHVFFPFRRL